MPHVREEMTRRVAFVTEEDSLASAYGAMRAMEVQHLPVIRNQKVVGILSDRDILLHAHLKGKDIQIPGKAVAEVMQPSVIVCQEQNTVGHVAELMLTHKIHCLPVVNAGGDLVGIITSADLLRLIRDHEVKDREIPFRFERPVAAREICS